MDLLGLKRQHSFHLDVSLWSIHCVTLSAAPAESYWFWMGPRTKDGSIIGLGYCLTCSTIWAYDPADSLVFEVAVANKNTLVTSVITQSLGF